MLRSIRGVRFLMTRAVTLHPHWVAEALYFGNDLYDAYHVAYSRNHVTDLKLSDPTTIQAIE